MISLDKKILDKDSSVAKRMISYGEEQELFVLVPSKEKKNFKLSPQVHIVSTGGNKLQQFFRLKKIGLKVIKENNIKSITTQDPFFLGLIGFCLKKKTGKSLEVQLHGDFFSSGYYKKSGFKNWLQYQIGKRIVFKADQLRVVGQRIKKSLVNLGVEEKNITIKPISLDIEKIKNYNPKIDLHKKYPTFEKIFLFLGRIERIKNIQFLLDIFQKQSGLGNSLLLVVGEGSQKNKLLRQVNFSKNIKFENWTDEHISYIKTADCVLFPSSSEGYGLVAMEANAAGTKIIMNDVGVANFELKQSERVEIVPIENREAWVEKIKKV